MPSFKYVVDEAKILGKMIITKRYIFLLRDIEFHENQFTDEEDNAQFNAIYQQ